MLTFTMKLVITGSEHQKRLVIEIKLQILDLCQSTGPIVLYTVQYRRYIALQYTWYQRIK